VQPWKLLSYIVGQGVVKDEKKAAELYQLAANQGDAGAQFGLGLCYAKGKGVVKDEKKAAELFQLAANQGLATAQFNLGVYFENGKGVVKDDKKAAELYQLAANQGYAVAQYNLGVCFAKGQGVVKDEKRALELYELAQKGGIAEAEAALRSLKEELSSSRASVAAAAGSKPSSATPTAAAPASSKPAATTAQTTEEQLLELVKQKTRLTTRFEDIAAQIKAEDWAALLGSLQDGPISHIPFVSSLIKDVLGPVSEAQGIAKAVIGIAATIIDMYMNAQANTVKCHKLGRQLGDVEPSLNYLQTALQSKTSAIMGAAPLAAEQMAQFKRETESLVRPLQTLQITAKAVQTTIAEWTAKGTRLFGKLRQMLTAKNFSQVFAEHSADIANGAQGLQIALETMTFLNVNEVQQQLRRLPDKATAAKTMEEAARVDKAEFSTQIKKAMVADDEFRRELEAHWDEIGGLVKSQFGDLHTYLEGEFHKLHKKMDSMHEDVSHIRRAMQASVQFGEIAWSDLSLEKKVGQGGYGTVFRAQWGHRGPVAVKQLLLEGTGGRILREIKAQLVAEANQLGKVASPHVVQLKGVVFEAESDEPHFALVMEFAAPDLSFFLGDVDSLSWGSAFVWPRRLRWGWLQCTRRG
jgi:hypothetical protein